MSLRSEKIASVVKKILSLTISKLANENNLGLASVSMVKLSKDLRIASIYINLLPTEQTNNETNAEQFIELLKTKNGMLRSIVAKEIRMRFIPELRFFYDDTFEQIEHIENLLNKVKTEAPYKENYGDESVYDEKKL